MESCWGKLQSEWSCVVHWFPDLFHFSLGKNIYLHLSARCKPRRHKLETKQDNAITQITQDSCRLCFRNSTGGLAKTRSKSSYLQKRRSLFNTKFTPLKMHRSTATANNFSQGVLWTYSCKNCKWMLRHKSLMSWGKCSKQLSTSERKCKLCPGAMQHSVWSSASQPTAFVETT